MQVPVQLFPRVHGRVRHGGSKMLSQRSSLFSAKGANINPSITLTCNAHFKLRMRRNAAEQGNKIGHTVSKYLCSCATAFINNEWYLHTCCGMQEINLHHILCSQYSYTHANNLIPFYLLVSALLLLALQSICFYMIYS